MLKGIFETAKRYQYLLYNLIMRDLRVKYRRSFFGVLWSLLNPILTMLVINAVFSHVFRFSVENFPLYLISGQILFTFFNESTSGALFSVVGASALIKKIYVPKYMFPVEKVMFSFVNLLFSMIALVLFLVIYRVKATLTMLLFPIPILLLLMFCIGFGLILSVFCVFFRDIEHLYRVLTTAWMYLTPVIYPLDAIAGNKFVYFVVQLNPLTHYIMFFRNVVLYGTLPTQAEVLICCGYSVFFLVFGFVFFKLKQDKFILHI